MSKMEQFTKMDDNRYFISCSARIVNFNFGVSKKVENNLLEFLVIQADTYTLILEFKL